MLFHHQLWQATSYLRKKTRQILCNNFVLHFFKSCISFPICKVSRLLCLLNSDCVQPAGTLVWVLVCSLLTVSEEWGGPAAWAQLRFRGATLFWWEIVFSLRLSQIDFFVSSYPESSICIHIGSHSAFSMKLLYSLTIFFAPLILYLSPHPHPLAGRFSVFPQGKGMNCSGKCP